MAIQVAMLAISAYSAYSSAQAQKAQGKAQEAIAIQQARTVELQGEQDSIDKRKQLMATIASVNAAGAASGIALDGQGSVANAKDQAKAEATRQLSLVRHNTAIGANDRRIAGQQAASAGRARATSTILSSMTSNTSRGAGLMSNAGGK